jgi:two-component system nitrogen regulation response regulator NtrX
MKKILIVDDQADIRDLLIDIVEDDGYQALSASNSDAAMAIVDNSSLDAILLDIWLEGSKLDGLELLEEIISKYKYIPIIMISGHGTAEMGAKAVKLGAYDYIEKPFTEEKLLLTLARAIENNELRKENNRLRHDLQDFNPFIGISTSNQRMKVAIEKLIDSNARVLLLGEDINLRKEAAKLIDENIKIINCHDASPTISLSGRGKGEGNVNNTQSTSHSLSSPHPNPLPIGGRGVLDVSHDEIEEILENFPSNEEIKTLFLDDLLKLSSKNQQKLLKIIATRDNLPRIISSAAIDVIAYGFNEELYYRLSVIRVDVPSLNQRKDDIATLAKDLMQRIAQENMKMPRIFSDEALAVMQAYDWRGGIRQLRNVVEWLLLMAAGDETIPISSNMLPPELKQKMDLSPDIETENLIALPLREAREIFEQRYIKAQLDRFGGNISKAAEAIGMDRTALHRKMKMIGMVAGDE